MIGAMLKHQKEGDWSVFFSYDDFKDSAMISSGRRYMISKSKINLKLNSLSLLVARFTGNCFNLLTNKRLTRNQSIFLTTRLIKKIVDSRLQTQWDRTRSRFLLTHQSLLYFVVTTTEANCLTSLNIRWIPWQITEISIVLSARTRFDSLHGSLFCCT